MTDRHGFDYVGRHRAPERPHDPATIPALIRRTLFTHADQPLHNTTENTTEEKQQ